MSLSSPEYFLFLSCVFVLFYLLPKGRPRVVLLAGASYFFYSQLSHYYVLVLAAVTFCAYSARWLLAGTKDASRRWRLFGAILTLLVMPLFIFKYLEFVLGTGAAALSMIWDPVSAPVLSLVLPVGISFFTFAAVGYVIDVYLEVIEPEHRPLEFALFLSLFPLISAGPIERASRILPQLQLDADFKADNALAGWRLILIGLLLKLVFADQLIEPANKIFETPEKFIPLEQLFGVIFYVFYIYGDFAGYSLIAIGSAMLFGLKVAPNFRQPFLSATIQEFWRNWHISLSSWARDYIFAPLQVSWRRYRFTGLAMATMISFILIGIWHGAAWGFIVFGFFHGALTIGSLITLRHRDAFWSALKVPPILVKMARVPVTLALVILTFVVYRANSLTEAWAMYGDILSLDLLLNVWYLIKIVAMQTGTPTALSVIGIGSIGWLYIFAMLGGDILVRNNYQIQRFPAVVQIVFYNVALMTVIYAWLSGNTAQPFMYYKF